MSPCTLHPFILSVHTLHPFILPTPTHTPPFQYTHRWRRMCQCMRRGCVYTEGVEKPCPLLLGLTWEINFKSRIYWYHHVIVVLKPSVPSLQSPSAFISPCQPLSRWDFWRVCISQVHTDRCIWQNVSEILESYYQNLFIRSSLSESHTSVTALYMCMFGCLQPLTSNFKCAQLPLSCEKMPTPYLPQ